MAESGGSTLPRRQLGKHLRRGREAAGMTLAEVGKLMQWSVSTVHRLEVGKTERIRVVDVEALCRIYEFTEEFTEVLRGLALQANDKSWWHEFGDLIPEHFDVFVDLESSARALTWYEPELVPGIVQTPAYAGTLIRSVYPDDSPVEHERRVRLRMKRQAMITRKTKPVKVDILLRESALRGLVGSRKVMAAQLRHLADLAGLPNVTIRVLPFSAGFPMGVAVGPFVVLHPRSDGLTQVKEPTVVYVESFTGDLYLEKPTTVQRYAEAYRTFQQAALDDAESKALLRRVAKEYST
ncbi:helix-turn-helix domain-containing protein [Nocardia cyriacigeorgica]|nr:helix-turn-helix transcriptional regulator [Nocardia cyriacigeorgica]TLF60646.1 helix-turn-helix domain-containing protein [Nocardia cyriacigeorgica]